MVGNFYINIYIKVLIIFYFFILTKAAFTVLK